MQTIISKYVQELPTIHPELIIQVPFFYKAIVHNDESETVEVRQVFIKDNGENQFLQINKSTPSIDRFLAHIREDARAKAYKLRKQNPVNYEQTTN